MIYSEQKKYTLPALPNGKLETYQNAEKRNEELMERYFWQSLYKFHTAVSNQGRQ